MDNNFENEIHRGAWIMDIIELSFELNNLEKEELIRLVVKLKSIISRLQKRIDLLEDDVDSLIGLDKLIESIK